MARLYYEFNVKSNDGGPISMMCLIDEIVLQHKGNDDFVVRLQPFNTSKEVLWEPGRKFEEHKAYCKDVDIIYELNNKNVSKKFEDCYVFEHLEEFCVTSVVFYPDGDEEFSNDLNIVFTETILLNYLNEKKLKTEEMNANIE